MATATTIEFPFVTLMAIQGIPDLDPRVKTNGKEIEGIGEETEDIERIKIHRRGHHNNAGTTIAKTKRTTELIFVTDEQQQVAGAETIWSVLFRLNKIVVFLTTRIVAFVPANVIVICCNSNNVIENENKRGDWQ